MADVVNTQEEREGPLAREQVYQACARTFGTMLSIKLASTAFFGAIYGYLLNLWIECPAKGHGRGCVAGMLLLGAVLYALSIRRAHQIQNVFSRAAAELENPAGDKNADPRRPFSQYLAKYEGMPTFYVVLIFTVLTVAVMLIEAYPGCFVTSM